MDIMNFRQEYTSPIQDCRLTPRNRQNSFVKGGTS